MSKYKYSSRLAMYLRRSTLLGWIFLVNTCSRLSVKTRPRSSVSRIGRRNMSSILVAVTTRPHWLSGPVGRIRIFSPASRADDGFGLAGVEGAVVARDVGMQPMAEEFFNKGDGAVFQLRGIVDVSITFRMTLSGLPRAGKGPLAILVDNFAILDNHVDGP